MPTTINPPITISVIKQPKGKKVERVVNQTLSLLETVFFRLNIPGNWSVSFTRQISNRTRERFKLIRMQGHRYIVVRCQPGDGGTCWEMLITPPKGYIISDIFNLLRTVDPVHLLLPPPIAPTIQEKIISILPAKPKVEEKPVVAEETKVEEIQAAAIQEIEDEIIEEQEPTPEINDNAIDLSLDPDILRSVRTSDHSLNNAIVAFSEIEKENYVSRKAGVNYLIARLKVDNFVAFNDRYTDATKVAAQIISGLNHKGYISYHLSDSRTGLPTKRIRGYFITPKGGKQIAKLLGKEISNIELTEQLAPTPKPPVNHNPETAIVDNVRSKIGQIEPLLEQVEKSKRDLATIDRELAEYTNQYQNINNEIKLLEDKMNQQLKIQEKLKEDISQYALLREEEQNKFDEVSNRLKTLIGV